MPGKSAILTAAQVGMSAIGMINAANNQKQQMANLRNERAWNFHFAEVDKQQKMMLARRNAANALSERRAMLGMRGVQMATGSSLLELDMTLKDLDEELYWIGQGAIRRNQITNMRFLGAQQEIKSTYGTSLVEYATAGAAALAGYNWGTPTTTTTTKYTKMVSGGGAAAFQPKGTLLHRAPYNTRTRAGIY